MRHMTGVSIYPKGYNWCMRFDKENLKELWKPRNDSSGEENGQVTIIGGSELFQGAPLLSLIACSRMVDMVFLATPAEDKSIVQKENLFSKIRSVIWVPRHDLDRYIIKSDAVLIGPGLMRGAGTRGLTKELLGKFPDKKWVIDAGSLQEMEAGWIPEKAILTPNSKEFELLFNSPLTPLFDKERGTEGVSLIEEFAIKHKCVIVAKGAVGYVSDGETTYEIEGGNAGLTKGGTGDVLAGVIVGLLAKNSPLLAAAAGSYLVKKTADILYEEVGFNYNADDVAERVFKVIKSFMVTQ